MSKLFQAECKLMSKINNANIVKFFDYFQDENKHYLI